jgi:hypothetical protein
VLRPGLGLLQGGCDEVRKGQDRDAGLVQLKDVWSIDARVGPSLPTISLHFSKLENEERIQAVVSLQADNSHSSAVYPHQVR